MREFRAEVVLEAGTRLGESPVWDPDAVALWWTDITGQRLHRLDVGDGTHTVAPVDRSVGAFARRVAGGFVAATDRGFALLEPSGDLLEVAPVEADEQATRMNDGKCDPAGRFWAGTMAYDARPGAGALYCLEPDLRSRRVLDAVTISNGLAWSHDATTLYYVDSPTRGIDAFDYDLGTGRIDNRRRIVDVDGDGLPDGMSIDADGCLWVALWAGGEVRRYTPTGGCDARVRLPVTQVTSCAFGGASLETLFITTASEELGPAERANQPLAGALFACAPGVTGAPAALFAG